MLYLEFDKTYKIDFFKKYLHWSPYILHITGIFILQGILKLPDRPY